MLTQALQGIIPLYWPIHVVLLYVCVCVGGLVGKVEMAMR